MALPDIKKEVVSLLILLAFLGLCNGVTYAVNTYRAGSTLTTRVSEFGNCRRVINNNPQDLFIPTGSQAEYDSFLSHSVPNVIVNACLPDPKTFCGNGSGGTYSPYGSSITEWPQYQNACIAAGGNPTITSSLTFGCGPRTAPDSKWDWLGNCN
jgi:hypothetical protein